MNRGFEDHRRHACMEILAHLERYLYFLLEHWRNMLCNDSIWSVGISEFSTTSQMYDKSARGFFAWRPQFYLNPFLSKCLDKSNLGESARHRHGIGIKECRFSCGKTPGDGQPMGPIRTGNIQVPVNIWF